MANEGGVVLRVTGLAKRFQKPFTRKIQYKLHEYARDDEKDEEARPSGSGST